MILNDREIFELAVNGMISPFEKDKTRKVEGVPVLSFGRECFGYTARLSEQFLVAPAVSKAPYPFDGQYTLSWYNGVAADIVRELPVLDVKRESSFNIFKTVYGKTVIIPPNSFVLGYSVERFRMPADVLGFAVGKSTYARVGATQLVTPLEPGWQGYLTLEIANTSSLPVKLYANEGVIQIVFFKGELPDAGYLGNYQNQGAGATTAKVI